MQTIASAVSKGSSRLYIVTQPGNKIRAVCLDLSTRQRNEKVSFVSAVKAALIEVSKKRLLIELNFFSFLQNVNARILLYFQSVML